MLSTLSNKWAFVASSPSKVVAAIDKIRSYPLFYSKLTDKIIVSNSGNLLRQTFSSAPVMPDALVEFRMAGYVTQSRTLFEGIWQLQAGQCLTFDLGRKGYQLHRYYRYQPQPDAPRKIEFWIDELRDATEKIFKRLIDTASGRLLLVPLSGGLDSRLIVGILRHLGYKNVSTFSYGPNGNYEAKIAKHVAEKAGFPWTFIATEHASFRDFFWSKDRREYWKFSNDLATVPNMQDVLPFTQLIKKGIPRDAIVVNGQSGDFISGGHIPKIITESDDKELLINAILEKHFSLRKSLLTSGNRSIAVSHLLTSFADIEKSAGQRLSSPALYEYWESQERQCKYVIGGQRIYDWIGLDWQLPLWDSDYLNLWTRVPVELKLHQKLYREYLKSSDYCRLFKEFRPTVWRWPGKSMAVLPIAQVIGLFAGRPAKERFYEYARYIGHYGPFYAPWGVQSFLSAATDVRNALPFFVDTWIEESACASGKGYFK